jgi:hypothetical protein
LGYHRKIPLDPFPAVIFLTGRWRGYSLRLDGTTFAIAVAAWEAIMKAAEFIGNLILCLTVIYGGVNLVLMGAAIAIGWLHP